MGHVLYPYLFNLLIAVGYGLILPAVAVFHVRHRGVRDSGAILGTIAGTAVVAIGLVASVNVDLRPAALFLLGMWWWTIGKMWVESRVLPRELGWATATLGVLALVGTFIESANILSAVAPGYPEIDAWMLGQVTLGAWLIAIAVVLARPD